jgi:peptide deformylase
VGRIDDAARALATDLVDTMRASPACVGLAATQLGVGLRAFAVDVSGHKKARSCHGELVLFDPEVLLAHGPVMAREGCMSVPDLTGDVARATSVVVRGLTVDGAERVVEADAFEARALLHELDHLDGLLFLDRVSSH